MAHGSSSSRLKQRRSAALSQTVHLGLRFSWIVLVVWCEIGEFFWSASSCQWSKLERRLLSSSRTNRPSRSTRVLVLSDPQVVNFSSPSFLRRPVKSKVTQFILDTFLRKGWMVAKRFKPDAVFITGDMMHSGRAVSSEGEYWAYANHFKSIFSGDKDSPPIFYVPGNRDVGLGPSRSFSSRARDRYREAFGEINYTLDLGNHTFVMLDAPGLIEEDYRRYAAEVRFGEWAETQTGTIQFVHELGEVEAHHPRILMSHVPLYRRERVDCGPNRERGFMTNDAGLGYQKLLGQETSEFIKDNIKPTLIFSGEDHDVCEYTHRSGVREVTVKTFSTGMGITHPGFQMLTLVPSDPLNSTAPTHADMSCNLPDQLGIYSKIYFPFAIFTVLVLFVLNIRRSLQRGRPAYLNLSGTGAASSSNLTPNLSRRQSSSAPIKSPRIPSSGLMSTGGMTPYVQANAFRRASGRSVPTSPYGSPRIGYTPELEDVESGAVFEGTSRASSIYGGREGGLHAYPPGQPSASDEYPSSPEQIDEGQGSSYFLPLPSNGLNNLSTSSLSSNAGLGLGLPVAAGSPLLGSSRPGQTRRVTRMSEKDSKSLALAAAGEPGRLRLLCGSWGKTRGVSRQVWACVGGEEALLARWLSEIWRVFWPAVASFALINLYFTF